MRYINKNILEECIKPEFSTSFQNINELYERYIKFVKYMKSTGYISHSYSQSIDGILCVCDADALILTHYDSTVFKIIYDWETNINMVSPHFITLRNTSKLIYQEQDVKISLDKFGISEEEHFQYSTIHQISTSYKTLDTALEKLVQIEVPKGTLQIWPDFFSTEIVEALSFFLRLNNDQ